MIIYSQVLPPVILQYFNPRLLSVPSPKLRDWSGTFEGIWTKALKLWEKVEGNPNRKARCELLKEEILELYERAKVKEKERESQTDHKTQEFGYRVASPEGLAEDVLARFMFGRKDGSLRHQFRRKNAIYKVKRGR